jgi:hypothetical protein
MDFLFNRTKKGSQSSAKRNGTADNVRSQFGGRLNKRFNTLPKNKVGVYIISPYDSQNKKGYMLVKIGTSASSLYRRLDNLHTYYPMSFYTFSLILTKNNTSALNLERDIQQRLTKYVYKHPEYEPRERGEWFLITRRVLVDTLNSVIEDNYSNIRGILNYSDDFNIELPDKFEEDVPKRRYF